MPLFSRDSDESEDKKPRRACQGLRDSLKQCLLDSDCVIKDGKTPRECLLLGQHPSVPDQCHLLRQAFFECKRSILDMRARFRGRRDY